MKKIFYWSPHLSNVATIKNVINSAKSIKKFNKNIFDISIINTIGEWNGYKENLDFLKINLIKLSNFELSKYMPITGFFKSRIIFLLIVIIKFIPLKKLLAKEKPKYIVIHLVTILPLLILLFSKTDTKFILRISGLPQLTFLRKFLWKIVSKRLFLVTCPSVQTKIDLMKLNIFPDNKIKVLYDPILDVELISKNLKIKIPDLIKDKKYFLNIGRLTKQKNQIIILKAFSKILKKYNDLNLLIIGDGEEKGKLKKYVESNKLDKNVYFLGQIKNIYPYVKNSMAVVSSSLWEDPGAVMVEAAFCKRIVISSNCPNGPKEFLQNGEGGYLFSNNNVNDLQEKILIFLKENQEIKMRKMLVAKKSSKKYTLFNHFKSLNEYLQLI